MTHGNMNALRTLASNRFVSGSSKEVLGIDLTTQPDWDELKQSFDSLPVDDCMNDGGTYRHRRFGRLVYHYVRGEDRLELLPHVPYEQPRYFNPLNGGFERHFAPLTSAIAGNRAFLRIVCLLGRAYASLEGRRRWRVNAFFNRIVASVGCLGKPVPEGMHRDGVTLMTGHHNYVGGETTLFDLLTHAPVLRTRLSAGGDMVVFRDDTVLHDTSPIEPGVLGYRDVLVLEFH